MDKGVIMDKGVLMDNGMNMVAVEVRQRYAHPAVKVWQLTGDFGGLKNWLPGVAECTVSGSGAHDQGGDAERAVTLLDGSVTREALEFEDQAAMQYGYRILAAKGFREGQEFVASFQVAPVMSAQDGEQCEIIWGARFSVPASFDDTKVEQASARVRQMYQFFLQHLASQL